MDRNTMMFVGLLAVVAFGVFYTVMADRTYSQCIIVAQDGGKCETFRPFWRHIGNKTFQDNPTR